MEFLPLCHEVVKTAILRLKDNTQQVLITCPFEPIKAGANKLHAPAYLQYKAEAKYCQWLDSHCPLSCPAKVRPNHFCVTYIIGHYNPSVMSTSHTTSFVCVNFINKWLDLQFKVDSEQQIFWEIFHGSFYFILRVFATYLLGGNRQQNTFRILFWSLAWDSNLGFSSNKPTHYLLDHGDHCVSLHLIPHKILCERINH